MPSSKSARSTSLAPSAFYDDIRTIIQSARNSVKTAVNTAMVQAYWHIGKRIIEQEQQGKARANYGDELIASLSERLTKEFGKGFGVSTLKDMRQFFLTFPKSHALRGELSWTHYRLLMRVEDVAARDFYADECVKGNWSTRELERQISTLTYERIRLSKEKQTALANLRKTAEPATPLDLIKDPFVLEFLNLKENKDFQEKDLEQAIIDHLQKFLLELGRDFFFVARQKRITLEGDHFYIDLVFYHRTLRCFVLIDLKLGKLTHQDLGQMQMYRNYYERMETAPDENPPIGILLCADKNDAVVKFTLPESDSRIVASTYRLHLPSEAELRAELLKEKQLIEQHLLLRNPN